MNPISSFRAFIVPVLVLVSIILIVPAVLFPQLGRIKEKNLEVKKGNERLTALKKKISDLQSLDENKDRLMLLEIERAVPCCKELAPLIVGVRNLAGQSGLIVSQMNFKPGQVATQSATVSAVRRSDTKSSPSTAENQEEKNKTTFSLGLRGRLSKFQEFLKNIEKAKRLLGVNSITSQLQEDGLFDLKLEVVAPYKGIRSCDSPSGANICPDIVAQSLPTLTSADQQTFDLLSSFVEYTNVVVPLVPTGVRNPFK